MFSIFYISLPGRAALHYPNGRAHPEIGVQYDLRERRRLTLNAQQISISYNFMSCRHLLAKSLASN